LDLLKRDYIIREPLLVSVLVLIAVVFSALTHAYSAAYDRRRLALGQQWFAKGNQELKNNRPSAAVDDFRTALLYDPHNWDYGTHLADGLMQAGYDSQAMNYYLELWQRTPSNGPVNLQLARLSAKKGDTVSAERYFSGAIFGDWPQDSAANRRAATFALIHFYLERGDNGHAESQLMILSDNLPEDPQLHAQVAELYARVGNDRRALAQYRQVLQHDPNNLPALLGAGETSFHLGDYRAAQEYLTRALGVDDSDTSAGNLLAVVQSAAALNPYERGLTEAEKIKRTLILFDIAGKRLQSCGSGDPSVKSYLERWKQLMATANSRFLKQHPEESETLLDFCASAEKLAQSQCGEPTPDDSASLAIARRREMEAR
jgi:tetratricopeptide (TPR) repeat protein